MKNTLALMEKIRFFSGYDPVTKRLILRGADHIPPEVFQYANDIHILDASEGFLSALPSDMSKLTKMRVLLLSNNKFREVPQELVGCTQLRMLAMKQCGISSWSETALPGSLEWLVFTGNNIARIPDSIGKLTRLRKCGFAGNTIKEIPESMMHCSNLELLRISANELQHQPPRWLQLLPNLTWYSDGGNPFCDHPNESDLELIPESAVSIEHETPLNVSPSSIVYKGIAVLDGKTVAVKKFKNCVTSDGYAVDDMRAHAYVGTHPHIIVPQGRMHHADTTTSLVLPMIGAEYQKIGDPPTFNTVSRDSFVDRRFTLSFAQQVARSVASAMEHLHKKDMIHGDLYAHNILSDEEGYSLVTDFGAATLNRATAFWHTDVRAFGCLIEDMINHMSNGSSFNDQYRMLFDLQKQCKSQHVSQRPTFARILKTLN